MKSSDRETYLGNVIDKSANPSVNFEARLAKGYRVIAEISAILKDIPLGTARIKAGLILREAKYLNAILYSVETSAI